MKNIFYPNQSKFYNIIINRIISAKLPMPELEYKFCPTRKFRFDMAYPDIKLGIEIDGSVFAMGRHTRGTGFIADCRKFNIAASMGWRVLRYADGGNPPMEDEVVNDIRSVFLNYGH